MPQIPSPAFTVDFETGKSNLPGGFKMMEGAAVKNGAPGAVTKALRIDSDGPYVLFPDLDISPSKFPELSMIIEFYLESIPEGSKGWLLNHDNGGYDRALVLHDERFGGISHGVGYPAGPVYDKYTAPETGKWIQMVVTYRQNGECAIFVSNEKAPITHQGRNNDGKSSLTLGRVTPYKNHWCDCWIKGVSVYDTGLSDEQVDSIFGKFKEEIIVPSGEASDDESVDEGEESINNGGDSRGETQNISLGKPASQSTTIYGGVASNAVNGITTGKRKTTDSTTTCTSDGDDFPWWEVDLEGTFDICKINIFNRDLQSHRYKLKDYTVEVIHGGRIVWSSGIQTEVPDPEAMISIPGGTTGDSVRISKTTKHLILAEVQVWGMKSDRYDESMPELQTWKSHTAGQNGGDAFDDLNAGAQGKLTQIDVGCSDTSINVIKTFYKNTGKSFVNGGGNLLGTMHSFKLNDDEYIVAIAGTADRLVNQIQFVTSAGRVSPKYGGGGGSPFLIKKKDMVLNYFFGRAAWRIDQIGAMFMRYVAPRSWRSNTAGHSGGRPFDDSARRGDLGKITQIRVCSNGSHVSAIETTYNNSGTYKNGGAHIFGNWYTFTLRHDEYIVAITGKAGLVIDSIGFVTSSGRVSASHGGGGGKPFRIEKDNMAVKHFFGRSAFVVDQIGAMFTSELKH